MLVELPPGQNRKISFLSITSETSLLWLNFLNASKIIATFFPQTQRGSKNLEPGQVQSKLW